MYLYYSKKPVTGSADGWEVHYPGSVMQFICLVNSLFPQDPLWTSPDFLTSLASAVFPFETPEVRLLGTVPFSVQLKNIPKRRFLPHRQAVYRSDILLLIQSSTGVQGIEVVGEPPLLRPSHPGRKQVCDFIRILLMDSLINIPVKDGFHPLIQLLEVRDE